MEGINFRLLELSRATSGFFASSASRPVTELTFKMNTFLSLTIVLAVVVAAAASPDPKSEVSGRHNDIAARVNLGTAISLVVPIALGVALVALLAPIFQSLFASPIPFGPTLGYARKSKSLFSGINQESLMQVLDTVTKAIDAYASADADQAKPKL